MKEYHIKCPKCENNWWTNSFIPKNIVERDYRILKEKAEEKVK